MKKLYLITILILFFSGLLLLNACKKDSSLFLSQKAKQTPHSEILTEFSQNNRDKGHPGKSDIFRYEFIQSRRAIMHRLLAINKFHRPVPQRSVCRVRYMGLPETEMRLWLPTPCSIRRFIITTLIQPMKAVYLQDGRVNTLEEQAMKPFLNPLKWLIPTQIR